MSGPVTTQDLACIYSAAILADDDIPITSDKISTLLRAAEVNVEPIWPSLYAKALQGIEIKQLITKIGNVATESGTTAALSGGIAGDAKESANVEKSAPVAPDPESDDDDDDMGLSLFD